MNVVGLFAAAIWLAELLPAPLLYALAGIAGRIVAELPAAPRRRLRQNLAHVLGVPGDSRELDRHVREVYLTHAANYADLLRAQRDDPAEVARRFEKVGAGWAPFAEGVASGRACVLVSAHFGRIELLNHLLAADGFRLTLPLERLHPPALFDLLRRQRARPTYTLVPHDAGLRPLLRALQNGEVVVFFAEWDPSGRGVAVRFFDAPARFPPGPAFVAIRGNVPLYIGYNLPSERRGRFTAHLDGPFALARTGDMEADVQRGTQLIAEHFERHIRRYPGQWVMFHDIWGAPTPELGVAVGATA